MILDSLDNIAECRELHPALAEALDFIRSADLAALSPGRHEVRDDRIYVSVSRGPGRARDDGLLEVHRKYIDIQIVLDGREEMGWKPLSRCARPEAGYDAERDIQFFQDEPDSWMTVRPGQFAVFFPWDAHLPLVSAGIVHKAVVKVGV